MGELGAARASARGNQLSGDGRRTLSCFRKQVSRSRFSLCTPVRCRPGPEAQTSAPDPRAGRRRLWNGFTPFGDELYFPSNRYPEWGAPLFVRSTGWTSRERCGDAIQPKLQMAAGCPSRHLTEFSNRSYHLHVRNWRPSSDCEWGASDEFARRRGEGVSLWISHRRRLPKVGVECSRAASAPFDASKLLTSSPNALCCPRDTIRAIRAMCGRSPPPPRPGERAARTGV